MTFKWRRLFWESRKPKTLSKDLTYKPRTFYKSPPKERTWAAVTAAQASCLRYVPHPQPPHLLAFLLPTSKYTKPVHRQSADKRRLALRKTSSIRV
jgi:hypothetical protein